MPQAPGVVSVDEVAQRVLIALNVIGPHDQPREADGDVVRQAWRGLYDEWWTAGRVDFALDATPERASHGIVTTLMGRVGPAITGMGPDLAAAWEAKGERDFTRAMGRPASPAPVRGVYF